MAKLPDIIQEKIEYNQAAIIRLQRETAALESQRVKVASTKNIEKWLGNSFESSSGTTPEFAAFARDFKRYIVKAIGNDFELVNWSRGHFYASGFLRNTQTGKLAYFSISDVRSWHDDWYKQVLIRTAKHERDYTGGSNGYTSLTDLTATAKRLTS